MISVRSDLKALTRRLDERAKKQVPFATAQALNATAFQVQRAEAQAIAKTFAHPRPFTLRSVQVKKATKGTLTARVFIRPEVASYLEPYEDGGVHHLAGKALLNPKNVRLDSYGQMTRATLKGLATKVAAGKAGHGGKYFAGTIRGVAGFWQRMKGGHLKLLLRFGAALPVRKHLDFRTHAAAVARVTFPAAFRAALAKALATAKR